MTALTTEQTTSIKRSYLNIVGLLLKEEKIESRYLRCLLKWAFQLHLTRDDLKEANVDFSDLKYSYPAGKVEKMEAIYHLVHMICLDDVVEDIELEVASLYAKALGFQPGLVAELMKSIVTADSDGTPAGDVRRQVIDFLKLHDR